MASDASQASPGPLVLRIKLRYPDLDTFIEKFAINVGRAGIFLATRGLQPAGTELRFELRLVDDQVVLSGVGRVAAVYEPRPDDPSAPYGMAIEFMRATRESRDVVLRMLEHRRALGLGEPALPMPELPPPMAPAEPAGIGTPEDAEGEPGPSSQRVTAPDVPVGTAPAQAARTTARPRGLDAERPRAPRTSALELVAQLTAQPPDEEAPATPVTWDALVDEPVDLQRALRRARAIAGGSSIEELAELGLGASAAERGSAGEGAKAPEAKALEAKPAAAGDEVAGGEAEAPVEAAPLASASRSRRRGDRAIGGEQRMSGARVGLADERSGPGDERTGPGDERTTDVVSVPPPVPARTVTQPRERFSMLPRRSEADESTPAGPPGPATSPPATPQEPRRSRVSRPERLTRPPGVFARNRGQERSGEAERGGEAERDAPGAVGASAAAAGASAAAAPRRPEVDEAGATASAAIEAAEAASAEAASAEDAGGYSLESAPAFERVLAELEDSELDRGPSVPPEHGLSPASLVASRTTTMPMGPSPLGTAAPSLPRTITAPMSLPDLGSSRPPWHAAVDETMRVDLDDSGFEILAESELSAELLLDGAGAEPTSSRFGGETVTPRQGGPQARAELSPRQQAAPPRGPDDGHHDGNRGGAPGGHPDGNREPTTARSALAAAVSRPTWTRSTALDDAEPTPPPTNELAPPTIPGRVPTREIDLESALDALDIEEEGLAETAAPQRPRTGDDEFPIELELED